MLTILTNSGVTGIRSTASSDPREILWGNYFAGTAWEPRGIRRRVLEPDLSGASAGHEALIRRGSHAVLSVTRRLMYSGIDSK